MHEGDAGGVQVHAGEAGGGLGRSVQRIAEDGVAEGEQVYAQLMRASGDRLELQAAAGVGVVSLGDRARDSA
jgi:hypothetical protein